MSSSNIQIKDYKNNLITKGYLNKIEQTDIILSADQEISEEELLEIEHIFIYIDNGETGLEVYRCKLNKHVGKTYKFNIQDRLETVQNRRSKRFPISFRNNLQISEVVKEDSEVMKLNKFFPLELINISVGGVCGKSTLNLPLGITLVTPLPFIEEETFEMKIINKYQENQFFFYNIQFEKMGYTTRKKLVEYLNKYNKSNKISY